MLFLARRAGTVQAVARRQLQALLLLQLAGPAGLAGNDEAAFSGWQPSSRASAVLGSSATPATLPDGGWLIIVFQCAFQGVAVAWQTRYLPTTTTASQAPRDYLT